MKKKYELFLHAFFDHAGLARHLEKRAMQGWFLEKANTNGFFRYRRGDPKAVRYAVTYFPSASNFDAAPGEGQRRFWELCESAGWKIVDQTFQMQIFRNEDLSAVPLETDPTVQIENIHRAMKANFLKGHALLAVLCVIQLGLRFSEYLRSPINFLLGSSSLSVLCYVLLLFQILLETGHYFLWRRKALRMAEEEGRFLPTRGGRWLNTALLVMLGLILASHLPGLGAPFALLFAVIMCGVFLCYRAANGITNVMKARGVSTGVNRAVTIVLLFFLLFGMMSGVISLTIRQGWLREEKVYGQDALPLTAGDLRHDMANMDSLTDLTKEGGLLLRRTAALQMEADGALVLDYTLWHSPLPAVLDRVVESVQTRTAYNRYSNPYIYHPIAPASFGAVAAWQCEDEGVMQPRYLLRYENCVMELHFGWTPETEEIIQAAERLKQA